MKVIKYIRKEYKDIRKVLFKRTTVFNRKKMKLQVLKKRQYKVSVMVIAVLVIASTVFFSFDVFSQQANSTVLDMRLAADNYDPATKTFTDRSGNNNNGVSANSAVFKTGRYGSVDGAMSFDGSSDRVFSSLQISPGTPNTVLFWAKIDPTQEYQAFSDQGDWQLGIHYNLSGNGRIRFHTADTNTTLQYIDYSWAGDTGWHLIGGFYDGTNVGIIFDGQIVVSGSGSSASGRGPFDSGLVIGNRVSGFMEDIRVYNYALTEQEVQDMYENEKVNFSASSLQEGLVGHWSMDEDEYLEGTYNGITYPDFSSGVGPYPTHSVNVYDEDNSLTGKALRVELTGEHSSNRVQFTHDTSFENGQSYIFSIYAKGEGNSIGKNLQTYSGLNWYKDMGPLTSEWKRYDTEIVTGSNSGGPGNIGLEYGVTGDVFYVHSPQLEDKDNLTPFVYGTRNGRLTEKTPYSNHGDTGIEQSFNFSNDRFGNINGAMSFSGSSYIQIPSDSAFNFNNNSFSVSAWVKTSQTNGGIFDTQVSGSRGYRLAVENGTVEFGVYANDFNASYRELNSGSLVNNNKWNLITATYNYDTSLMSIYINGELDITSTQSQVAPSSQDLYIGVKDVSSGFFTGNLDDLRIYNRALSESEIKSLYDSYEPKISAGSLNKGLVLDMPLTLKYTKNETAGAEIMTDKTPYSNDGQNYGVVINELGATFNGSDDYIGIPASSIQPGNEISISFWASADAIKTNSLIYFGDANGRIVNIHLLYGNGNTYWDCGVDAVGYDRIYKANPSGITNEWHYWTFTKNASTGEMKIFLDGSLWASGTGKNKPITTPSSDGEINNSAFDGSIKNLRIYNRALSDTEVKSLYDKGRNQFNMIIHPE
jgi:hypothetical protein